MAAEREALDVAAERDVVATDLEALDVAVEREVVAALLLVEVAELRVAVALLRVAAAERDVVPLIPLTRVDCDVLTAVLPKVRELVDPVAACRAAVALLRDERAGWKSRALRTLRPALRWAKLRSGWRVAKS